MGFEGKNTGVKLGAVNIFAKLKKYALFGDHGHPFACLSPRVEDEIFCRTFIEFGTSSFKKLLNKFGFSKNLLSESHLT
jgi:hypothetical protein